VKRIPDKGLRGSAVLGLFAGVHFGAIDDHVARGGDAEAHLIAFDTEYSQDDIGANMQGFGRAAGEDEHVTSPVCGCEVLWSPMNQGTGFALGSGCAAALPERGNSGSLKLPCAAQARAAAMR
jgi:hypothetical protein